MPDLVWTPLQLGFMSGLSGEVPQSLGKMQQLGYLDIAGNMLTGAVPAVTSGNMINLRLAENFLTGTITPAYGTFPAPVPGWALIPLLNCSARHLDPGECLRASLWLCPVGTTGSTGQVLLLCR